MITLDFQGHPFVCYTLAEFAEAGMRRSHRAVSNTLNPSEGLLLKQWLRFFPDAVLVTNGRSTPRITVYAPKKENSHTKTRALFKRHRCGAGDACLEGLSGALSDKWAFYDVRDACRRRLRQWEEAGVLLHDRFDTEFKSKSNPGPRQP